MAMVLVKAPIFALNFLTITKFYEELCQKEHIKKKGKHTQLNELTKWGYQLLDILPPLPSNFQKEITSAPSK